MRVNLYCRVFIEDWRGRQGVWSPMTDPEIGIERDVMWSEVRVNVHCRSEDEIWSPMTAPEIETDRERCSVGCIMLLFFLLGLFPDGTRLVSGILHSLSVCQYYGCKRGLQFQSVLEGYWFLSLLLLSDVGSKYSWKMFFTSNFVPSLCL